MFITPAYAQTAGAGGMESLLYGPIPMMVALFAIMYFLIIRPQRQRMKQHQELVSNLRRGDTVVTSGGLIGKVAKVVDDGEIQLELSEGVKVRVVRGMVQEVRSKTEPVKDNG
ncbi:preprotein translocase subunit YajC [Roseibium porphyridii]|uniref:Sec translocon accessory complex subunit YajC n=1 Tax=Roseibium porphyridii TaxID=2866279 RepID=A0ABY8EX71_9HYPH|nr:MULTISPECIES: preprotein translocase subunit YajC [Stappiaceae]QFT32273.1 preprotein translocase subunit YajC [Labrenzia sp. THAF82]WFE87613.1 preprotein translocase subunit YajC [Roseibium sp. KMA01]